MIREDEKTTNSTMAMAHSSSCSSSVALPSGGVPSGVGESDLELLVNLSQCSDRRCSDLSCSQFKKRIRQLEAALRQGASSLDLENQRTLRLLHEHYIEPCCLPHCHVPWCRLMSYRCLGNQENTMQELITLIDSPMLTMFPKGTEFDEFIKLDPALSSQLVEWEDWLVVSPLSPSHTAALVVPLSVNDHSVHWVVKMTALQDSDNQLFTLKKMRGLRHPHIVGHIWAASCDVNNIFVICTEYVPGRSVGNMLEETGRLSYTRTQLYFLQVLYAAQRLHELNIVFLNWKCSNLLLDVREEVVKLSNFVTSMDLSCGDSDTGTIKLTLSADIVPPELLQNGAVSHRTDSWGLACIAHEMLTGVRPWYHLRHESPEHIRKQILAQAPPAVSDSLPERVQILTNTCLQKSPESRLSVPEMLAQLHAGLD